MYKKVNPAAIHALNEALSLVFWYKKDLRTFLSTALPDNPLVSQLDWTDFKRNVVRQLVATLDSNSKYQEELVGLMISTADMGDPIHLKRLENGEEKYKDALQAIKSLTEKVMPYKRERDESEEAERHQRQERARAELRRAISDKLDNLKSQFYLIVTQQPQERGYSLEKFLNELFALFDIDAKASFRVVGEQIDGAFTFEGTEYLLEAKWRQLKSSTSDLDNFSGKIKRKLENTLGLFISINGFEANAVQLYSQNGAAIILMTGADIMAVLEDRISFPELITKKRQHASRTGIILLEAKDIL